MKQFLSFVRKEFYHILRDRRTMLILLGMPIAQIILFGFAISTEINHIRMAVLSPADDVVASRMIREFDANRYFSVNAVLHSPQEIDPLFRSGKIDLVLAFENRFSENLYHMGQGNIQLIVDATDPNTATSITTYATSIVNGYVQSFLTEKRPEGVTIVPQIKLLYNPQMKSAYNFVPGVMGLILMLICAMMTSISIVREKERGTMEILLVSPMKPILVILSKVVPYFVLSCVNLTTILLLSVFMLHVPVAGSLFWLSVLSLLFILVSLSLGILISTVVRTQVAAMLVSGMVLILPVIILSGLMFPIESMPALLQAISNIIPARWYISAVKKIMIEGLDVSYALKEVTILGVMALFLIVVSLKKFKNRLE